MAQPAWITSSGSLGTVPEGIYYNVQVQAQAGVGETVFYRVIAGSLPTNTYCNIDGDITGVPTTTVTAGQDVVVEGARVTSKFTIRAYTTLNNQATGTVSRLCDRTFTITVSGVDAPGWITPAGSIGTFYDGTLLQPGFQFEYTDNPLPGVVPVSLVAGQLPPGISISGTGLLSGYFAPNPVTSVLAGYARDGQGYSGTGVLPDGTIFEYKFDFNTRSLDFTYQFTLQVTNGVQSELRTFTMSVYNPALFTADAVTLTANPAPPPEFFTDPMSADNAELLASISNVIAPVITNTQGSIGTYRNDNFFAYQFIAYDYSGNAVEFEGFTLPPGLTLDPGTGWLYGYIPDLGVTEETYNFSIRVVNPNDPTDVSEIYYYSITFIGAIGSQITWITPGDLGSIDNGSTSTFTVEAVDLAGKALQYRLRSGSNSQLPQGLTLLPSGNIVGRVSFNLFSIDNHATTFDADTTTFDLTFKFTVNAYSADGTISVFKEFTIHVVDAFRDPYNNLYISCMPPKSDRDLITSLLQNDDIFPQALLYRPDDPNFGVATSVVYNHAYGLSASAIDDYVMALQLNHYWKNLILGEIKTAQALDDLGNVMYEVVYSEVVDDQANSLGQSPSKEEVLAYPVEPNTIFQINTVYPNSLVNMRDQVIDTVGQVSNILPRWMYSKQKDGRVLGFTPSWVIAYTNPNASGQVAYNIQQLFGVDKLNLIDFKADRYEIDRSMTVNWDPVTTTVAITDISSDGDIKTIEYATTPAVTIRPGDVVTIANAIPADYNGTYYVQTSVSNQITVNSTVTTAWISGGSITTTPHWTPSPATEVTFDVKEHYQLNNIDLQQNFYDNVPFDTVTFSSDILPAVGSGYSIGDELLMPGTYFGGTTPANDVLFRVCQINATGGIVDAFCSGFSPFDSAGTVWPAVPATLVGEDPAATSTSASIALATPKTVFGSISGTKLTATGGAPAVGQLLYSTDNDVPVLTGTYIVAPIFGVIVGSPNVTVSAKSGTSIFATGTYTNLTQKSTSGDGVGAVFTVNKPNIGVNYSSIIITVGDGGEGYKAGDTIIISGADLGGVNGTNDLTFILGNTISNIRCWTVNKQQIMSAAVTMSAITPVMTVGGTITGTFAVGNYISSDWENPSGGSPIAADTQITVQLTSTASPVATTTATGTTNTRILTVASATGIAAGQLIAGTGVSSGTVVSSIVGTTVTLSQALTVTASGSYTFKTTGGAGTYAVDVQQAKSSQAVIATDAVFSVESVPGVQTIFDGGSVQFASPSDRNTNTNDFDRYLLYPKYNVIDNLPQSATWTNVNDLTIEWENAATPPNPEAFWNT